MDQQRGTLYLCIRIRINVFSKICFRIRIFPEIRIRIHNPGCTVWIDREIVRDMTQIWIKQFLKCRIRIQFLSEIRIRIHNPGCTVWIDREIERGNPLVSVREMVRSCLAPSDTPRSGNMDKKAKGWYLY